MILILHKDGAYQQFDTITDATMYTRAVTLEELTLQIKVQHGEYGLLELPARLERAHATGCSSTTGTTLDDCIRGNRAGPNGEHISRDQFIAQFLTLAVGTW